MLWFLVMRALRLKPQQCKLSCALRKARQRLMHGNKFIASHQIKPLDYIIQNLMRTLGVGVLVVVLFPRSVFSMVQYAILYANNLTLIQKPSIKKLQKDRMCVGKDK